jgi:hypothetical protein
MQPVPGKHRIEVTMLPAKLRQAWMRPDLNDVRQPYADTLFCCKNSISVSRPAAGAAGFCFLVFRCMKPKIAD